MFSLIVMDSIYTCNVFVTANIQIASIIRCDAHRLSPVTIRPCWTKTGYKICYLSITSIWFAKYYRYFEVGQSCSSFQNEKQRTLGYGIVLEIVYEYRSEFPSEPDEHQPRP